MQRQVSASSIASEDLGFKWERSNPVGRTPQPRSHRNENLATINDDDSSLQADNIYDSSSISSSNPLSASEHSESNSIFSRSNDRIDRKDFFDAIIDKTLTSPDGILAQEPSSSKLSVSQKDQKHILYIQMQLSKKTLLDYFHSREGATDIPSSLRMFLHITRGVKHVHDQGLIHRDLKPSNCFMDDSDVVKIGDFGLSRKETGPQVDDIDITSVQYGDQTGLGYGDDNTVGVGTSSYASPEQIIGSDYDSSSDVYSLGIILFELCYPMVTAMERYKAFEGIRQHDPVIFPYEWYNTVAKQFPSIHVLILRMLSHSPKERPTAAIVENKIELFLSEYTVRSLDSYSWTEDSIFLRVEAENADGILAKTKKLIEAASQNAQIKQYSLRVKESKAIMEFALSISDCQADTAGDVLYEQLDVVMNVLRKCNEIKVVRRILEPVSQNENTRRSLSM